MSPLRARGRGHGPAVIILAKTPVPGRAKTRLCPPCSPAEAASIAAAALEDTLDAVARAPAGRRVLALDGAPGPWLRPGFEVIPQRGRGLAERLAAAFADVGAPALLIGMDTPQVTPALLGIALGTLLRDGVDAVLGDARDGGWWIIGLRREDSRAFEGVPMSTPWTGWAQRRRLRALGVQVATLPPLRDVDLFEDARAVAREVPFTRFAAAVRALGEPGVARSSTSVGTLV